MASPFRPAFCLLSLALLSPVLAQRDLKDIPNPDPEEERKSFILADGLEVNLFAADPMISKPIQMNWDQQGRLWVVSSETYPQVKPGQKSTDKILILTDKDHNGVADTVTTFADDLLIPTGVVPADGGAYVANSTEVLFMKDTDGNGKADQRTVVLSGFGTEDTHHIIHTFKTAPDGQIYFNQSVYIHAHVETPYGPRRLMGSGIWQYRPETGRLEVFTRGQVNPWGHVWDRWGQSFTTDGAYGEGPNYAYPGASYFSLPNPTPRILKGLNPGQPKHASLEIVSGRHLPVSWHGSLITNDFRGNRVNRFAITEDGGGYKSVQQEDVVKTNHRAFRPVDVCMGPDGALYLADWYNPIIQHGEVDFRDERRDHVHGRIWRITAKGRPTVEWPKIAGATIDELLEHLKAPEDYTRRMAKRELRDRGASQVLSKLESWLNALDPASPDYIHHVLEGMWTQQHLVLTDRDGQGSLFRATMIKLLTSTEPRARAAAVRALYQTLIAFPESESDIRPVLEKAIADPHPRVRLETIQALRQLGDASAVETALQALDMPVDGNIDYSLWNTCWSLQSVWLPAFQKGQLTFGGNFAHAIFALKASGDAGAMASLGQALKDGKLAAKDRAQVWQLIGELGGAGEIALALDLPLEPAERVTALAQVATAAVRKVRPAGDAARVAAFLDDASPAVRAAAARACGALKLEAARVKLGAWLGDAAADSSLKEAAVDSLVTLGGEPSRQLLTATLDNAAAPAALRARALGGLVNFGAADAAKRAVAFLGSAGDDAAAAGRVFDAFLTRQDGPAALTVALAGKNVPEKLASLGIQKASSAAGQTKPLIDALTAAGHLQPVNQAMTPEEMQTTVAAVKASGDAARGESVYRRAALVCTTCHAIGGVGAKIGPDLVSLGASAQIDYIIESLLNPTAKIKEGYHTTVVTTKDGGIFAGAVVKKDDSALVLRDAAGKEQSIATGQVAKTEISPVSLMPPGLTASLRRDEFLDLVRFLSELGREGAYKTPANRFVRSWKVRSYDDQLPRAFNLDGFRTYTKAEPAAAWSPLTSTVAGDLPSAEVPVIKLGEKQFQAAQFALDVTAPGLLQLALNDIAGLRLFLGENEVPLQSVVTLNLPAGRQILTAVTDPAARQKPLRIELLDAPGSATKVEMVAEKF